MTREPATQLVQIRERLAGIVDTQHEIAAAGLDLDAVIRLVVERARLLTGASGARIALVEGNDLVVRGASGSDDGTRVSVPVHRGGRPAGELAVTIALDRPPLDDTARQTLELLAMMLSSAVDRAAELEALARFETIFRDSPIGMGVLSLDGRIVDSNEPMRAISGYTAEELASMNVLEYTHPDWIAEMRTRFTAMLRGEHDSYRMESQILNRHGGCVWTDSAISLVRDQAGQPQFAVLMAQDVTQRKVAEAALVHQAEVNAHQALHDALTGLPNRTLFRERVEQAILGAERDSRRPAVLVLDLDSFKEVNDSLGHAAGDAVLQVLAGRLTGALRASDTVARLGGDEFGMLIARGGTAQRVAATIERIRAALREPIVVSGSALVIEGSVGAALFPQDGRDFDTLVQHADVAMYGAKGRRSGYTLYGEVPKAGSAAQGR